jgi:hypothetical protein
MDEQKNKKSAVDFLGDAIKNGQSRAQLFET